MKSLKLKANLESNENKELREKVNKRFSQRLRQVRKQKKMTQQELAEAASLHLTYVGHLELGKYHPTLYTVWKLAKALGVSVGDLVD